MPLITARSWEWSEGNQEECLINALIKLSFIKVLVSLFLNSSQLEIQVQVYVLTLDQQTAVAFGIAVTDKDFFQFSTVQFFGLSSVHIQRMVPSVFMGKVILTVKLLGIIWSASEIQFWTSSWSKRRVQATEWCSNSHHVARFLLMLLPAKKSMTVYLPQTYVVCGSTQMSSSPESVNLRF